MADEAHISVEVAYRCAQQVRDVFHQDTPAHGRHLAAHLIESLPACPIPEIARLGRTLRKWKDALDAYFDTGGASNAPREANNTYTLNYEEPDWDPNYTLNYEESDWDPNYTLNYEEPSNPTNYQLRMLLIAGGLDASTHTQL